MLRIAIVGLRVHAIRALLTCLAVTLGVGFFAGTLIYADTSKAAFADDFARPGRGVDVAVNPPHADGYDPDSRLDTAALAKVRAVTGVALAEGRTVTSLPMLDRAHHVLSNDGHVGWAVSLPKNPVMSPFVLVAGRLPARIGEAVLDRPTAERLALSIGDEVTVLDTQNIRHRLALVGIVDFGAVRMFQGWSVVGLTDVDLAALTHVDTFSSIVVAGDDGVDPARLRQDVQRVVGSTPVVTGDALRADLASDSAKYAGAFARVLLASSLVALVIAGLVVFNTFTILVTQRTRELALLRTVGASRGQVFQVIGFESIIVGVLASALGLAASIAMAKLIFLGRDVVGDAEPVHALVVTPLAILAGLLLGTLTTVAAAVLPAVAASRISPLSALRAASGDQAGGYGRVPVRIACAALLAAAGTAVVLAGAGLGFDGTTRVLGGAMIVFVGLVVVLPLVVVPLTRAVGWLPSRLFGVPTRLALRNAQRNPRRVAAATTALMVGAALVSLFSVVLETSRDQAGRELAENFPVDFAVRPVSITPGHDTLPDIIVGTLRARPEFAAVVRSRKDLLWTAGGTEPIAMSALEPGQKAFVPEVTEGSLDGFGPGRVALRAGYAHSMAIDVGGHITGHTFNGKRYDATVIALFDDAPIEGEAFITWADFGTLYGAYGDQLLIRRAPGVSANTARAALDSVLAGFPLTSVTSQAERSEALTAQLQRRLEQFGILLGISIVIAIFGIGNTLALSVWERTRESATLRALGLSRRQLRAMLMAEALLMAVVGAALGVAFGVAAGWITARSLINVYGHGTPSVPVAQLAGFVVLAGLAAVVASLLPARRANRRDLVSALQD